MIFEPSETFSLNASLKNFAALAESVNAVIDSFMAREVATTSIITAEGSYDFVLKDFKEDLLLQRLESYNVVFRQETIKKITTIPNRRKASNIFLIKNFSEFQIIYKQITSKFFKTSGLYLIAITSRTFLHTEEIFKLLWKKQIYNVIVLFEDRTEAVAIHTFFPFNEANCNDTTPQLINQFLNGSFREDIDNLFPDKIANLHKCPIKVSISTDSEPYIFVRQLANESFEITGRDINLIESLARDLKFVVNYSFVGKVGYFLENGTSEGPLKALLDKKSDLSLSSWFIKEHRLKYFDCTTSYISEPLVFIVPPGRELTAFEKLVFPFDLQIWALILTCFTVGILVIFTIKYRFQSSENFVFGAGVNHPYFNMFIAFIGGMQKVLPKTNFARFLLTIFLLYSLVIRTLYQASFYKFLQSNKHSKEIASIDEMVARDFSFYAPLGYADLFQGTISMQTK